MPAFTYASNVYRAMINSWVDGDTVDLTVDLGQHVSRRDHYRLNRLDAPETALRAGVTPEEKQAGIAFTSWLRTLYPAGTPVWVSTSKADKYGRWLIEMWVEDGDTLTDPLGKQPMSTASRTWVNLNDKLLTSGKVKAYNP